MGLINSSFSTTTSGPNVLGTAALPSATAGVANTLSTFQQQANSTPVGTNLPSWLTTNPDSLSTELQNTFQTAPASITDAANVTAAKEGREATVAFGQQTRQAANATRQQANVERQQGGTAATSSIVGGQMEEDAQKNKVEAKVQIAQMQQDAKYKAASLSSSIAGNLASLRESYLGMLAGNATTLHGQTLSAGDTAASLAASLAENQASTASANNKVAVNAGTEYYTGERGAGSGGYGGPLGTSPAGQTLYNNGFRG